jgi:hypothetical protein
MSTLPEFLRYTRKPRRTMERRYGEGLEPSGVALVDPSEDPAAARALTDVEQPPARRPRSVEEERRRQLVESVAAPASEGGRSTAGPAPAGVGYSEGSAARPRWSSELNQETEHNAALRDAAEHPQEAHGWRRLVRPVVAALLAGARTGDPLAAAGAAGAGAAVGAVDPRAANRLKYGSQLGRSDSRLSTLRERRKEDLSARQQQAQIGWWEARPGLEGKKLDAQAVKLQQDALQREIGNRLHDPSPFDPNDPYDAGLAERAQAAGVNFSQGAFGDRKNPATLEVIDPNDPTGTRKTRLVYDREGGTWAPLTADGRPVQTGYVQPVGEDGLTEAQRRTDADRDTARENTESYRKNLLGLSTAKLEEQMRNGISGRAARDFNLKTRGLFDRRRQLESQIQGYNTRAAKAEISGAERDRRVSELRAELEKVTQQVDDARSEALGAMGAASAGGSHVSRAKFRSKYPQFKDRPDADVDAAIRASGYEPMP